MDLEEDIIKLIQELFNNLPVVSGLKSILEESNLNFDYTKSKSILGNTETWKYQFENYTYRITPSLGCDVILKQGNKENGHYYVNLELFYEDDYDFVREEFYQLKREFEMIGERIENEQIVDESYNMKSETVTVFFDKKVFLPNLTFMLDDVTINGLYKITILFENKIIIN